MWFTEGIENGLKKSRNQQLILMVYLEGESDASIQMTKKLETDEDIKSIVSEKAIALKLNENSKEAKMFHQIYPIKSSPTIYLISHLGKLIESFSDTLDKNTFIEHFNENNNSTKEPSSSESINRSNVQASSSSAMQADVRSIDEKRKELIERIKEKNQKAEEEYAKNKEMERIQSGKKLEKLRREHEKREVEQLIKQRERDAKLDKIERERILKQIEEDRQEKEARFEQERLKREREYNQYRKEQNEKNVLKNRTIIKLEQNEIKIQFRLPDSQMLIGKFNLHDTLQVAVDYVKEKSEVKNFQFAIAYPKRNLDSKNFNTKLIDLGLKNSVVFLVIEEEDTNGLSSNKNSITNRYSIINSVWEIIFSISNIIFSLISGLFTSLFGANNSHRNDRNSQSSTSPDNQQPPNAFDPKKRSFRSNFDNDNDNRNTYNGNSTEQQ